MGTKKKEQREFRKEAEWKKKQLLKRHWSQCNGKHHSQQTKQVNGGQDWERKSVLYIEIMSFKSSSKWSGWKNTQKCNSKIFSRIVRLTYRVNDIYTVQENMDTEWSTLKHRPYSCQSSLHKTKEKSSVRPQVKNIKSPTKWRFRPALQTTVQHSSMVIEVGKWLQCFQRKKI